MLFVICNDDIPIGVALYYDIYNLKTYDFSQFFIDQRYQRNGFGYEAATQILQMMKNDGKYDKVFFYYIEGDYVAQNLYKKLRFKHTGEVDGNEIIMELKLR